jgi:hypothetical protein
MTVWSDETLQSLRRFQRDILYAKFKMSFMLDSYEWWDNLYRWGHIVIATLAPIISIVTASVDENSTGYQILAIVIGTVTAMLIKIKDYVVFDKIRDRAKEQSARYQMLYIRIRNEMAKEPEDRQGPREFFYWTNREFLSISAEDPRMTQEEKDSFKLYCEKKGVKYYDDDVDELKRAMDAVTVDDGPHIGATDVEMVPADDQRPPPDPAECKDGPPVFKEKKTDEFAMIRNRASTDRRERQSYLQTVKTLKTPADLAWTMERFRDLENG